MKEKATLVTRKGQVTIPIEIRQALNLKEGDSVIWEMKKDEARLRRAGSVVAQTAGILKGKTSLIEHERAAMERAIAEETESRSKG